MNQTFYKKIAHVLLPKYYVRFRLTGELVTEVSDASGTSLLDVRNRRWSQEMLSTLQIDSSWVPRVVESQEITGAVDKRGSEDTTLARGTPVVGGGGDQAAGAVGNGVVKEGIVSVTVGTSGVVFAHSSTFRIEPDGRLHAFCHSVPESWHLMGVTLSAGGSLRWFRDMFCENEKTFAQREGTDPYEAMTKAADSVPPGSEGLVFLPYLTGERTPYPDPYAKGAFIGFTVRRQKAHAIRAVLEGVAFSLLDCLELMKNLGVPIREIRVSGGGARSTLWKQILADVFERDLLTVASTEGAPYGAALLAAVGTKHFGSVAEACSAIIKPIQTTRPQSTNFSSYRSMYEIYKKSYPALKPLFNSR